MSKLKGKKATAVTPRLKCLFYGGAGAGKTTAAISFPRPYLIDTEKGAIHAQYTKLLDDNGGVVFQTADFDELLGEVKTLLTEKHEFKTLIIDPLTTLYNDLLDKAAANPKIGSDFGRHYGEANKKMKSLLNFLLRLDMNVIITAHSKNEYGDKLVVLGQTYDCYKKLDYLFDLVFEVQKRGKERVAVVKKTRLENFPDGDVFPFSYDEIANRYGREILEKDAVAEVLATQEQVTELKRLIDLLCFDSATVDKWLSKANAETMYEMNTIAIQKCIDHLNARIKGAENV